MNIKNHKKDNGYNLKDGSYMRGTITMTSKEWQKAYLWLWGQYQKAIKDIDTYKRDSLASLKKDSGQVFSIGITATSLLAKRYKLSNYKNQNYAIKII
jgi:hypothetical protein